MSHRAWLDQAEDDLLAARVLSDANHHSQAVWLAAQAVEKAHKAILIALGLQYEDRHFKWLGHATSDIHDLLPDALQEPRDPRIAVSIDVLELLSQKSRYPAPSRVDDTAPWLAPVERIKSSRREVEDATLLLAWCRERVARALRAVQAMRPEAS